MLCSHAFWLRRRRPSVSFLALIGLLATACDAEDPDYQLEGVASDCTPIGGTTVSAMDWLQEYRSSIFTNPVGAAISACPARIRPDGTSTALVKRMADACRNEPTETAQILCTGRSADVWLGGSGDRSQRYVCRHHTWLHAAILGELAIEHRATGAFTHAWVEASPVEGGTIVADAYNAIYLRCN